MATMSVQTRLRRIASDHTESDEFAGKNNIGNVVQDAQVSGKGTQGTSNQGRTGGEGGSTAQSLDPPEENKTRQLNDFARRLKGHKIPLGNVFKLPDSTQSYNHVDLVRAANANFTRSSSLFQATFESQGTAKTDR